MSDDEFIYTDMMLFLAWVCNVYAEGLFENRRSKTPLLLLQYEQGPVWRLTDAPGNRGTQECNSFFLSTIIIFKILTSPADISVVTQAGA